VSYGKRLGGVAVAVAAVALFAAGCGSDSKTTPSATPAPSSTNALINYTNCLRNNGVTITLPSFNPSNRPSGFPRGSGRPSNRPSGAPRPSFNPSDRPSRGAGFPGRGGQGGFGELFGSTPPSGVSQQTWDKARQACASVLPSFGPGQGRGGRDNGALAAYRNCLQDHGVTASGAPDQLNTADPKVAAAVQACAALKPTTAPSS
jgi:hypothetical protein